jgi:hypothetical protein
MRPKRGRQAPPRPGELDGSALAREATTLRPGLKLVYMTGVPGVARVRAPGAPFGEILPKPWRIENFLKTVDVALQRPRWVATVADGATVSSVAP